jgi:uncharacterized protein
VDVKDCGLALWAKPILSVVFDGISDTVNHEMKFLCRDSDQLTLGSDDMDNATATLSRRRTR